MGLAAADGRQKDEEKMAPEKIGEILQIYGEIQR